MTIECVNFFLRWILDSTVFVCACVCICITQAGRKGEHDSATNLEARGESKIENAPPKRPKKTPLNNWQSVVRLWSINQWLAGGEREAPVFFLCFLFPSHFSKRWDET